MICPNCNGKAIINKTYFNKIGYKCKLCNKEHKNTHLDYCDKCFTELQKQEQNAKNRGRIQKNRCCSRLLRYVMPTI
jgi:hypothetical protein